VVAAAPTGSGQGASGRGRVVTVFGGTGFLGRRVVRHLLEHGFDVRITSRRPERAPSLPAPNRAGAEAVRADVHDEASVAAALLGAFGAVNAVGLYVERGAHETFRAVHVEAAARIARLAREAGAERLVHVSGIGADPASPSGYIRARGEGEIAVRDAFPGATLVRPSVVFGPDDRFLTTLARLLRILPAYPLFGRGRTRLQPVHGEDVAEAIARVVGGGPGADQPCYELGGPRIYTYAKLLRGVADRIGTRARLLPLPFALWEALASLSEFAPGAPLTRHQVALMRRDNVASRDLPGLRDLHVAPTALEDVLPAAADGRRR
jgi:NADH dehydrogenase